MRFLLPLILALTGAGAGLAAGHFLKPEPVAHDGDAAGSEAAHSESAEHADDSTHGKDHGEATTARPAEDHSSSDSDFVKLNNQFIIPILQGGRMKSMVVLSLTLETVAGTKEEIFAREPKIRDAFLQVLFDYANAGGFDGTFTAARALDHLRVALREEATRILGATVLDVLVTDIARQDS